VTIRSIKFLSVRGLPPLSWRYSIIWGIKHHFKLQTAERRHVLYVGVGGDRTHAVRPPGMPAVCQLDYNLSFCCINCLKKLYWLRHRPDGRLERTEASRPGSPHSAHSMQHCSSRSNITTILLHITLVTITLLHNYLLITSESLQSNFALRHTTTISLPCHYYILLHHYYFIISQLLHHYSIITTNWFIITTYNYEMVILPLLHFTTPLQLHRKKKGRSFISSRQRREKKARNVRQEKVGIEPTTLRVPSSAHCITS
jgi:hypothetical protein